MTKLAENDHSYEPFASLPFNQEIDERLLLAMGPSRVESHTDLATGYGAVIGRLLRLGMYEGESWLATGVDIDPAGLEAARKRFATSGNHVRLIQSGVQEEIPGIARASQDLVTMFNAIHLTNPVLTFGEAARMAKPGAILLVSSAYEKSANPDPAGRMLVKAMTNARRSLREQGFSDFSTNSVTQYSNDEYRAMAEAAGFTDVEIVTHGAQLDREALAAIFNSRDFAQGVFPNIPLDNVAAALVASIDPMLEYFGRETLPRNYMLLKATKAELPQA